MWMLEIFSTCLCDNRHQYYTKYSTMICLSDSVLHRCWFLWVGLELMLTMTPSNIICKAYIIICNFMTVIPNGNCYVIFSNTLASIQMRPLVSQLCINRDWYQKICYQAWCIYHIPWIKHQRYTTHKHKYDIDGFRVGNQFQLN